ncbi:MAG: hypothetical protein JRM90_05165 [Nitrososphaerota archaeon]|nr:hypothetical protein [Nitrososphaerota archaeon]
MNRRGVILRASVLALVLASLVFGSLAIYYYTLPPTSGGAGVSPPGTGQVAVSASASPSQGLITVVYNGTTYHVPAKGPNAPNFSCPAGTAPSLCTILQETCGNGVGSAQEPWKTCYNCIFDAGCTGDNACDPYTHQCGSPASACQIIAGGYSQVG